MESVLDSTDLMTLIFLQLPFAREMARCRVVCRWWCRVISTERARVLWGGAASYAEFARILTEFRCYHIEPQDLCASGVWSPSFTLKVILLFSDRTCPFPFDPVAMGLMSGKQMHAICRIDRNYDIIMDHYPLPLLENEDGTPDPDDRCMGVDDEDFYPYVPRDLQKVGVTCAILEGLMTPEQMAAMPSMDYIDYTFLYPNGLVALRERLITPAQIAAMPTAKHVCQLFRSQKGLDALREGNITPEIIASDPDPMIFDRITYDTEPLIFNQMLHGRYHGCGATMGASMIARTAY